MDFDSLEEGMFGEEAFQHILRQQFRNEAAAQMLPHGLVQYKKSFGGARSDSALQKIMQFDEQSSLYMKQGKYFEAYGLLKSQYKLGPEIHFAPVLVKYYVTLMQTDRADKAEKIRDELTELFKPKFADSADEVFQYAENLMEESRLWEAILFYQISLQYCEKASPGLDATQLPQTIAAGLTKCIIRIFRAKPGTKKILKQNILCWIKTAKDIAIKEIGNDKKFSSLVQANLLNHQAKCFLLFHEFNAAEKLFKEATNIIQHCHKSDAESFSNFAEYLGFLGIICFRTNRLDEAEKYLNRSTAAAKKAKDLSFYDENVLIQNNEQILKKIKEQQK